MAKPVLSVAFFGSDSGEVAADTRYAQLLSLCEQADQCGLHAVWIPERHFQNFGDIFPNPSILAAAIAARTQRIGIRAGSIVAPLHNPIRLFEDWSVIQALSGGRAGLSIATGWNKTDFALNPSAFKNRREIADELLSMLRGGLAQRAFAIELPDGDAGTIIPRPHPQTAPLPLWLTTSGNPKTWEAAGSLGVGILAATIGQTKTVLMENVARYRAAAEHEGNQPWVTLMVHTAIGDDRDAVRADVEAPLKKYIGSFMAQSKSDLSESEQRLMVSFAFERYWNEMSMLGTVETASKTVTELGNMGCDEIACLIDFGPSHSSIRQTIQNVARIGA
jgi:natural product biosynthesis luciferase-like monooxygenase protein